MINVSADTHYIGGFVVTQGDTWLAMDTEGEWVFTKDFDQRWVFDSDKAAYQVVGGFTRVEIDAAFDNGFIVVRGDRYLARHSGGDWMFTRTWARRWVFGTEQEAKEIIEGLE
jgi:hypothetical protein